MALLNYMSHGSDRVSDQDLAEIELTMKALPWLPDILQELQYLRGADLTTARVTYLEAILDKLGVEYEEEDE